MHIQFKLPHVRLWLALAGAAFTTPAQATDVGADWVAVEPAVLDQTRGGFTFAAGLEVSLGIERLVSINGQLVSQSNFQIANLNQLSAEQARQTSQALSSVNLLQNGGDNIYRAAAADTLGGSVIQNSLDGQLIQSQTVINSTVNSLSLLKTLNFQGTLGDALVRAAGAR